MIKVVSGEFDIRITCGPIQKEEAGRYFSFESDHFEETGIFIDVDIYKTNNIQHDDVPSLTKKAMGLAWKQIDSIAAGAGV